jgi:hypothetical protein
MGIKDYYYHVLIINHKLLKKKSIEGVIYSHNYVRSYISIL